MCVCERESDSVCMRERERGSGQPHDAHAVRRVRMERRSVGAAITTCPRFGPLGPLGSSSSQHRLRPSQHCIGRDT